MNDLLDSRLFVRFSSLQSSFCAQQCDDTLFAATVLDIPARDTWHFYNSEDPSTCEDPGSWDLETVPDTDAYTVVINLEPEECYTVTVTNLSPHVMNFCVGDVTFLPTFTVHDIPGGIIDVQPGETKSFEVRFETIVDDLFFEADARVGFDANAPFSVVFRDSDGNCVTDAVFG